MDLYRYFHPHHNPRLRRVAVRLQELGEIEQAAIELRNAIKRAEIRTELAPVGEIRASDLAEMQMALDYLVDSLTKLCHAHPGDDIETLQQLREERKNIAGWESWSKLLGEQLARFNGKPEEIDPNSPVAQQNSILVKKTSAGSR